MVLIAIPIDIVLPALFLQETLIQGLPNLVLAAATVFLGLSNFVKATAKRPSPNQKG